MTWTRLSVSSSGGVSPAMRCTVRSAPGPSRRGRGSPIAHPRTTPSAAPARRRWAASSSDDGPARTDDVRPIGSRTGRLVARRGPRSCSRDQVPSAGRRAGRTAARGAAAASPRAVAARRARSAPASTDAAAERRRGGRPAARRRRRVPLPPRPRDRAAAVHPRRRASPSWARTTGSGRSQLPVGVGHVRQGGRGPPGRGHRRLRGRRPVRPRARRPTGSSTRSASSRWSSRRWPPATRCSARWARSRAERDAFTAPQVALVRALADHAALAMANARLIEELARSREAVERQAVRRALAARAGHPDLGRARPRGGRPAHDRRGAPAARRRRGADRHRRPRGPPPPRPVLVGRGGDPRERLAATTPTTRSRSGASGRAVITGQTYISRDYLDRPATSSTATAPTRTSRAKGIHGVIATPLFGDQGPFGAITVWSTTEDAFDPERRRPARDHRRPVGGRARARAADRGAGPLARGARPARRGGARRCARSARGWATMGDDPGDVLNRIVHETARLLGGERARLDLLEPLSGSWLWTYPPSTPFNDRIVAAELVAGDADGRPTGLAGPRRSAKGRPVAIGRLHARRAVHATTPEGDQGVPRGRPALDRRAPVVGEEGLLGVLQAGHRAMRRVRRRRPAAASPRSPRRPRSPSPTPAWSTGSRRRRRRSERTADGGAGAARDRPPADDHPGPGGAAPGRGRRGRPAARLDRARSSTSSTRRPARSTGRTTRASSDGDPRPSGSAAASAATGVVPRDPRAAGRHDRRLRRGRAVPRRRRQRRLLRRGPASGRSRSRRSSARRRCWARSRCSPAEPGRFGPRPGGDLLAALADLATIAIHNAELIRELGRSREETARRAETERTLREIAARVTSIREPGDDPGPDRRRDAARPRLGRRAPHPDVARTGRSCSPVVIAGGMDDRDARVAAGQEFPIDGGINGLAAGQGRVVWTPNYATDPRIPRDEEDLDVAERMGLGAMAAAPLRAPGGEVIGTLAVSYRKPGLDLARPAGASSRPSPTTRPSPCRTRTCSPGSRRPRRATAASSRRRRT